MEDLPFIRITVLGSERCGKTSLINSFVNNDCHTDVYQPTHGPSLYYKVCRIPPEGDEKGEPSSVMVEVEDTFGSNRSDEGRDVSVFLDMKRKPVSVPKGVDDFTPFVIWKPPRIPLGPQDPYVPLTIGRMGIMIAFDATEVNSWQEAQRLHTLLKEHLENSKVQIRPVIFFLATKIDKNPNGEEFKVVIEQAEAYTQAQFLPLHKVSAFTAKNVRRTFFTMARIVVGNEALWEIEYEERGGDDDEEDEEGEPFCAQS